MRTPPRAAGDPPATGSPPFAAGSALPRSRPAEAAPGASAIDGGSGSAPRCSRVRPNRQERRRTTALTGSRPGHRPPGGRRPPARRGLPAAHPGGHRCRSGRHPRPAEVTGQAVRGTTGAPGQGAAGAGRGPVVEGVDLVICGIASAVEPAHAASRAGVDQRSWTKSPRADSLARVRVGLGGSPTAGQRAREWFGRRELVFEPDDRRLVVPAVGVVPQVSIEEPVDLVQFVDVRTWSRVVGPGMDPVADEGVRWSRTACVHPKRGVHVAVVPAADVEDGRLRRVVRRERPLSPVGPVRL